MCAAERGLLDGGTQIEQRPELFADVDLDVSGVLTARLEDSSLLRWVCVRPGLDRQRRELLMGWAAQRFARLVEHGWEPDGWSDISGDEHWTGWVVPATGAWRVWAREVDLPAL